MHDLLARQIIGPRPAYRLTPLAARLIGGTLYRRCRPHHFTFLEILEQRFGLLDPGIELLRGASELHAPQLGKLGLILFDPQPGAGQLGPRHRQFRLPLGQQGARLGDLWSGVGGIRHQPAVYTRVSYERDLSTSFPLDALCPRVRRHLAGPPCAPTKS